MAMECLEYTYSISMNCKVVSHFLRVGSVSYRHDAHTVKVHLELCQAEKAAHVHCMKPTTVLLRSFCHKQKNFETTLTSHIALEARIMFGGWCHDIVKSSFCVVICEIAGGT